MVFRYSNNMLNWFETPQIAIKAFEMATGLSISVHEYTGALWGFLPPSRFLHMNPVCVAAKSMRLQACIRFDVLQTETALVHEPQGRVQVCHAGLVEWVVPTFLDGQIQRVFFAGQRKPGLNLTCDRSKDLDIHPLWSAHVEALEPVDDEEAGWILESLRQLAARVEQWRLDPPPAVLAEQPSVNQASSSRRLLNRHLVPRQHFIHHYIQAHHSKPIALIDLATAMHLSEDRAGHAVKQACGKSFIDLLIRARLRTAAGLLRHTDMSVAQVAMASGFRNLSHFHSVFRKRMNSTPHRYRSQTEMNTKALR